MPPNAARRPFASPSASPFAARLVVPLVAFAATATLGLAQVRTNVRNTMQIDGLAAAGAIADERCWPFEANGFAHGDVDGDGDLDLLAAGSSGSGSRLWFNEAGAFARYVDIAWFGARCVLFDADGDGDLDALIAGGRISYGGTTPTGLFLNDGLGGFTHSPTTPTSPSAIKARSVSAGDLDGDGDLDLVLCAESPDHCLFWRNMGAGVFVDATPNVQPPILMPAFATLADVDSDGDLDLVLRTNASSLSETRRNDGTGSFQAGASVPFFVPSADVQRADVDGDGLLDEVGVRPLGTPGPFTPDQLAYVRRNTGSGFVDVTATWFEPHALVDHSVGWDARVCDVFDVDGDGDPDLVTGGSEQKGGTSTTVGIPPTVFLNRDRQQFLDVSRPAFPLLHDGATAMDAGDIDGDGDIDLVTHAYAHYGSAAADVWRQDASGRFGEAGYLPFSSSSGLSALKLVDVDGDGDLDVVGITGWGQVYPGFPGQHRLALNNGAGQFTEVTATHMPASANTGGASCAAGDVDGDGDADLVVGSYDLNWGGQGVPLRLLRNDGTGIFSAAPTQMPTTPFNCGHVALADLDGDGDLDLIAALDRFHASAQRLLFFANDGTGTFVDETAVRLPPTTNSWGLSLLDRDGDGDLDIAQSDVDLTNDGSGHFTATPVAGSRLLVADLDEDGIVDALDDTTTGSSSPSSGVRVTGGRVLMHAQNALGFSVLPVDLDQDGDIDFVVAALRDGAQADWHYTRTELVYNLTRDLRVIAHPRLGAPYRVRLRAANGAQPTVAFVCLATQTVSPRVSLGAWGMLALDPAAILPWEAVVIPDADTAVETSLPIPNLPAALGLPLSCQSLLIPIGAEQRTHLTNATTHTIER